jgi:ParB family chromosome partitioning protein
MPDDALSSDALVPGVTAVIDSPEETPPPEAPPEPKPMPDRRGQTLPSTRKVAGPLAVVATEKIANDDAYRLLPLGEVDALAQSMAHLGQLFPVELRLRRPNQYQVVVGFRRVAAARMLQRSRVLARVHPDLSDDDALLMALADLCSRASEDVAALEAARDRLTQEHRLFPEAAEMLEAAIERARGEVAAGEEGDSGDDEEVELDSLCSDVMARMSQVNQDLASIAELWADVEPAQRRQLLDQLRYPGQLADYLETLE